MKSLLLVIAILFVSLFATAQTSTGKFLTVSNKQVAVMQGARGGLYYINTSGNKTYLTDAQEAKVGTVATTAKTVVSVPTAQQLSVVKAKKQSVLIDNGSTVIYHGVVFNVETGARGGRFFQYINAEGVLTKKYLAR
jgi:hypothetical protein